MGLFDFWCGHCPKCDTRLAEDAKNSQLSLLQSKVTGAAFRKICPGYRFKYVNADHLASDAEQHRKWVERQRSYANFPQGSGEFAVGDPIECHSCGQCLLPILHIDDHDILTHRRYAMMSSCIRLVQDERFAPLLVRRVQCEDHAPVVKLPLLRRNNIDLCDGEVSLADVGVIDGSNLECVMAPLQGFSEWAVDLGRGWAPEPEHGWLGPSSPAKDGPLKITITHGGRECEIGVAIDSTVGSLAARAAFEFDLDSTWRDPLRRAAKARADKAAAAKACADKVRAEKTAAAKAAADKAAAEKAAAAKAAADKAAADKAAADKAAADKAAEDKAAADKAALDEAPIDSTLVLSVLQVLRMEGLDEPTYAYLSEFLYEADTIQDWIDYSQNWLSTAAVDAIKACT